MLIHEITGFHSHGVQTLQILGPLEVCPVVTFRALELVEIRPNWPGYLVIKKNGDVGAGSDEVLVVCMAVVIAVVE